MIFNEIYKNDKHREFSSISKLDIIFANGTTLCLKKMNIYHQGYNHTV